MFMASLQSSCLFADESFDLAKALEIDVSHLFVALPVNYMCPLYCHFHTYVCTLTFTVNADSTSMLGPENYFIST